MVKLNTGQAFETGVLLCSEVDGFYRLNCGNVVVQQLQILYGLDAQSIRNHK